MSVLKRPFRQEGDTTYTCINGVIYCISNADDYGDFGSRYALNYPPIDIEATITLFFSDGVLCKAELDKSGYYGVWLSLCCTS